MRRLLATCLLGLALLTGCTWPQNSGGGYYTTYDTFDVHHHVVVHHVYHHVTVIHRSYRRSR